MVSVTSSDSESIKSMSTSRTGNRYIILPSLREIQWQSHTNNLPRLPYLFLLLVDTYSVVLNRNLKTNSYSASSSSTHHTAMQKQRAWSTCSRRLDFRRITCRALLIIIVSSPELSSQISIRNLDIMFPSPNISTTV